jgi:hypothetical protein
VKKVILMILMACSSFAYGQILGPETIEAQKLVNNTTTRMTARYCIPDTLTCRDLFLLNDKATGAPVTSFYDVFVSAERAVAATTYFVSNGDRFFHMYFDDIFDGTIGITKKFAANANLFISFSPGGFPTIYNATAVRGGTTRWLILTTTYSDTKVEMVGTEYDNADPTYSAPVDIVYVRTN